MSNISIKRINRDVSLLYKEPLDSLGIYIDWDSDNIKNVKALIIGPEDTPYRYGYYFFNIQFQNDYPHVPPKVSYETRFRNIRFNPNLYTCGKVCVSILNTWSGPQWTSCQSLKSVLLSLQSLLNENPLQNEPGFENVLDKRHKLYNSVIEHENINISIIRMITNTPQGFEVFKPVLRETFLRNYSKIYNYTSNLITKYSSTDFLHSKIYSMNIKNQYCSLFNQLENIKSDLVGNKTINDPLEIKNIVKKEIIRIKKKKMCQMTLLNYLI
jgi:ubiquitin-conjugating enzyme E2 Z